MARKLGIRGSRAESRVVGNRLALVGAILYFLEWVAISLLPGNIPTDRLGHDAAKTVADYTHRPAVIAFAAGWFSVVLLGRVVYVAGVRRALSRTGAEGALADIALAAMAVSVTIEVFSFGLAAAAAWLDQAHAGGAGVVALDTASSVTFELVFGPIGVSVLTLSVAMFLSRLFSRWLTWLGVVAGGVLTVGGIVASSAQGSHGTWHNIGGALSSLPVPFIWIWMIVTAVILWRAAPEPIQT